jgi:UDP-N-acetylmuramoyl-L-alanyl-D-glutamate--2,6-diaminopimelate ligase
MITADSREVRDGAVFFACRSASSDGTKYLQDAIQRGAIACVVPGGYELPEFLGRVAILHARDVNKLYSLCCQDYFHFPDRELVIIGITGTNGKTTVVHLIEHLLSTHGQKKVGVIGSLGVQLEPGDTYETGYTTPDSFQFYRTLRAMVEKRVSHVVMEVSSHAVRLDRIFGCRFWGLAFLNLSRDHLDFHSTMEEYFESKRRLFEWEHQYAFISTDTDWGRRLFKSVPQAMGVTTSGTSEMFPSRSQGKSALHRSSILRIKMEPHHPQGVCDVELSTGFSLFPENVVMAVAIASRITEIPSNFSLAKLEPPGRYQLYLGIRGQKLMIDFAHTPDALEQLLKRAGNLFSGHRIHLIFGCGGDRDQAKRPQMGGIAETYAHSVVITNDNPRNEDPLKIAQQILSGMVNLKAKVILDRKTAIETVLCKTSSDDLVIIAGKGNEKYQIIKGQKIPFSDYLICKPFLADTPLAT